MKSILQKIMLILMLVCVSSTVNAFAENSEEEAELLKVFNVNTVSSEALISRGDFVALTMQAANLDTYDTKSVFNDVEGEQGRYISTAYDHGYVCGDGTGSFNPNDVITTEDAMTICLRILGFKEVLNSSNTTSKDNLINRLNLNKGVVRSDSLSFNQANKLILNMLDSKYMDADYYSNFENISYFLSDDTFMNKAHKIYKIDNAQVQAVKGVNLSGFKDLSKDDVAINGTLYLDEYGMNYDMLGSKGKCYIKESADESSVVYFSRYAGDDAVLTIRSNEIANVKGFDGSDSAAQKSNPFLEYYANNVKKKINIDKKVISYFNYTDTLKLSNADLSPEYGRLLCIDKDNDGIYDVVLVEKYDYYLVSAVDLNENVIQDKYEKRDIKLSEFDDEDIEITYNGRDIIGNSRRICFVCYVYI